MQELTICLKPNTLFAINALNVQKLQASTILQAISVSEDRADEQLKTTFKQNVENIAAYRLASVQDGIEYIETPDGKKVTEPQHILDWLSSVDLNTVSKLEQEQAKLKGNGMKREFNFTCSNGDCAKDFKGTVSYNPSFFFSNK